LQEKFLINTNKDFPQIIINSINAPELVGEITSEDLIPYIDGLKELDGLNCDFIIMVCNTIHLYHKELQSKIKTSLLDLREEVKNYLIKNKIKSALIIGTKSTIKQGLYRNEEIALIEPSDEEIDIFSDAIINFNKGFKRDKQIVKTKEICNSYFSKGIETIILGCTEFALMLQNESFPKVNTLDILLDSVVERFERRLH